MAANREQQAHFIIPKGKELRKLRDQIYLSQLMKATTDLELVEVRAWIKYSHELEAYVTQQS